MLRARDFRFEKKMLLTSREPEINLDGCCNFDGTAIYGVRPIVPLGYGFGGCTAEDRISLDDVETIYGAVL